MLIWKLCPGGFDLRGDFRKRQKKIFALAKFHFWWSYRWTDVNFINIAHRCLDISALCSATFHFAHYKTLPRWYCASLFPQLCRADLMPGLAGEQGASGGF